MARQAAIKGVGPVSSPHPLIEASHGPGIASELSHTSCRSINVPPWLQSVEGDQLDHRAGCLPMATATAQSRAAPDSSAVFMVMVFMQILRDSPGWRLTLRQPSP